MRALMALAIATLLAAAACDERQWYSEAQLREWQDALWAADIRGRSGASTSAIHVEFRLFPLRGVREEFEATIAQLNIPRDAVELTVGCDWPSPLPHNDPPGEKFSYTVETTPVAAYGETIELKQTLQTTRRAPVTIALGGIPYHAFVVETPDGELVWHSDCGRGHLLPIVYEIITPGFPLEIGGAWEQVDNRGEPVPPGIYVVRGLLDMGEDDIAIDIVATPPYEFMVLRPERQPWKWGVMAAALALPLALLALHTIWPPSRI